MAYFRSLYCGARSPALDISIFGEFLDLWVVSPLHTSLLHFIQWSRERFKFVCTSNANRNHCSVDGLSQQFSKRTWPIFWWKEKVDLSELAKIYESNFCRLSIETFIGGVSLNNTSQLSTLVLVWYLINNLRIWQHSLKIIE